MIGVDLAKQERCRRTIIKTGLRHENDQPYTERIDQQMPLTPVDLLAAIIPPLRASHFSRFDRVTVDAHDTGRAPSSPTRALAHHLDQLGPCPIVTPLHTMVVLQICTLVLPSCMTESM